MKKVIIVTLIILVFISLAAGFRRNYPIGGRCTPYTVLTTAQTTVTLPFNAQHSWIINRGQSNIAYRFDSETVVPNECCQLKPGESLQNIDIPYSSISFLAVSQSGSVELIVSY